MFQRSSLYVALLIAGLFFQNGLGRAAAIHETPRTATCSYTLSPVDVFFDSEGGGGKRKRRCNGRLPLDGKK